MTPHNCTPHNCTLRITAHISWLPKATFALFCLRITAHRLHVYESRHSFWLKHWSLSSMNNGVNERRWRSMNHVHFVLIPCGLQCLVLVPVRNAANLTFGQKILNALRAGGSRHACNGVICLLYIWDANRNIYPMHLMRYSSISKSLRITAHLG